MNKPSIKWVMEGMLWGDGTTEQFEETFRKRNINYAIVPPEEARNGFDKLGNEEECVIFYGSLETAKLIRETKKWIPGVFYDKKAYDCSSYYPHLGKHLLNGNKYAFFPYGELHRMKDFLYAVFGEEDTIFIRPDNGSKEFTGKIVYKERFEKEIEIAGFYGISSNFMVLVSSPKNIQKEWRFFIVDGQVVTGSLYKDGYNKVKLPVYDDGALELAKKVGIGSYQPDRAWVLDICQTQVGNYYVLEIGCFSCSGIYGADIDKIVQSVSKTAIKEYEEYH